MDDCANVAHLLCKKHVGSWSGISLFTGFYVGNVVNLTFGTLGVNDVVAAAMVVAVSAIITKKFYSKYYSGNLYVPPSS